MRGLLMRGSPDHLARALERVLLHCEVSGVAEREAEIEVWLADSSPEPPSELGVQVLALRQPTGTTDWRRDDSLVEISPTLRVRPPWVPAAPDFAGVELVVPRGMAFGSGEHESTQLAMRLMQRHVRGGSLADAGTGSGILALLAVELGCRPVRACDIDPDAVRAARDLVPDADVRAGDPTALPRAAHDHVVANMTAAELMAALPSLVATWNRTGALLLSGMRHAEVAAILRCATLPTADRLDGSTFTALRLARRD